MNDLHFSPADERRRVWLFSVNLPEEEVKSLAEEQFDEEGNLSTWPLKDALGVTRLDKEFVEVFKTASFEDYGLDRYLTEAHGMSEAQVAEDSEKLKNLEGHAVLVVSKAFGGQADQFNLSDQLTLVGSYGVEKPTAAILKAEAKAASKLERAMLKAVNQEKRHIAAEVKQPRPAIGGRLVLLVLIILFLLVGVMFKNSGS